jgi:hypothetical protein
MLLFEGTSREVTRIAYYTLLGSCNTATSTAITAVQAALLQPHVYFRPAYRWTHLFFFYYVWIPAR